MPSNRERSSFEEWIGELNARHLGAMMQLITRVTADFTPPGSTLRPMLDYQFSSGGKRLRAMLPLATAEVLDTSPDRVLPFAAACEMLHNATLVHDDLQDGDEWRRGRATIWRQFGTAQAINLGDAMFYYAILLCQALDCPPILRQHISQATLAATLRVIDGQERELALRYTVPSFADYLTMVEGKTSAMFSLALVGASMLVGESPERHDALNRAGNHLGVLFQIQDDVIDLFGSKGRERAGSDIAEGKASALVALLSERASQAQIATVLAILRKAREETTDEDIDEVRGLIEGTGVLSAVSQLSLSTRQQVLDCAGDHSPLRSMLQGLCELMMAPLRDALRTSGL